MSWRERTRRLLPYIVTGALGFLLAYLLVFFLVFPGRVVERDAAVPSVVGLQWDDAVRRLESEGFRVGTGEQVYHAVQPKQTVLEQNPRAGSVEPRGARVLLDVSLGQRQARIPRLTGLDVRTAQLALEREGFTTGDVIMEPSEMPRGQVIESVPAEGELATLPAAVRLRASAGPATIEVPELVGRPYPEARAMLEQLGLTTGRAIIDSTVLGTPGMIVSQSPAPRTTVRAGSSVRLTVAP